MQWLAAFGLRDPVEAEHGELAGMVRDFEFDHIISLVNLPKEPERT